ncbi:hypothetical protein V6N11_049732 [Hibiscus sabdariffa]|uniref:Uncharacterized protein n=1 Tax=Hibiscus sabdariffa TaxID=183260 RepID=A0ABR2T8C1_9ROSI
MPPHCFGLTFKYAKRYIHSICACFYKSVEVAPIINIYFSRSGEMPQTYLSLLLQGYKMPLPASVVKPPMPLDRLCARADDQGLRRQHLYVANQLSSSSLAPRST